MNKKWIRTGIFSLTTVFTFAIASSTVVSAHGNGYQQKTENREYGHPMHNHSSSWEENETQEEGTNGQESMHSGEKGPWNRKNSKTNDGFKGNCHASSIHRIQKNSSMMKSRSWVDGNVHSPHSSNGYMGNRR